MSAMSTRRSPSSSLVGLFTALVVGLLAPPLVGCGGRGRPERRRSLRLRAEQDALLLQRRTLTSQGGARAIRLHLGGGCLQAVNEPR